jgi:sigma-B regulation protein RsbU (phosphoserine phosphatase)
MFPPVATADLNRRADDKPVSPHTMMCSEIWSANSNVAHSVELPGLSGWVYSAPIELGHDGGDVHYLSVCQHGVLCRVALADVSGHGRAVSVAAERLLGLMRRHINQGEQREFLHELSDSLRHAGGTDDVTFATALVVGFDSSSGQLVFTSAGHPAPLWYHADERRWTWLRQSSADAARAVGFPLGMGFSGSEYTDTVIELGVGDLLMCYTDGLSETADSTGRQIGDEFLELASTLPVESPMAAGATLLGLVDAFRRGEPMRDDETLIVLQRARPTRLQLTLASANPGYPS